MKTVIEMAREADRLTDEKLQCPGEFHPDYGTVWTETFAAIVRADEREKQQADIKIDTWERRLDIKYPDAVILTPAMIQEAMEAELSALREALSKTTVKESLTVQNHSGEAADMVQPVAWVNADNLDNLLNDRTTTIQGNRSFFRATPLYAAPVRTKDLTDDEIEAIVNSVGAYEVGYWQHAFARAVIAADREKNK